MPFWWVGVFVFVLKRVVLGFVTDNVFVLVFGLGLDIVGTSLRDTFSDI